MSARFWVTIPEGHEYDTIRKLAQTPGAILEGLKLLANGGQVSQIPNRIIRFAVSNTGQPAYLTLYAAGNKMYFNINKPLADRLRYKISDILGQTPWSLMEAESAKKSMGYLAGYPIAADDGVRVFLSSDGEPVTLKKVASFTIQEDGNAPKRTLVVWVELS